MFSVLLGEKRMKKGKGGTTVPYEKNLIARADRIKKKRGRLKEKVKKRDEGKCALYSEQLSDFNGRSQGKREGETIGK